MTTIETPPWAPPADLVWRLLPASVPVCTDCGGSGQVASCLTDKKTWCRLCDGAGVLPTDVPAAGDDNPTNEQER